jgi:hypothetical protein
MDWAPATWNPFQLEVDLEAGLGRPFIRAPTGSTSGSTKKLV